MSLKSYPSKIVPIVRCKSSFDSHLYSYDYLMSKDNDIASNTQKFKKCLSVNVCEGYSLGEVKFIKEESYSHKITSEKSRKDKMKKSNTKKGIKLNFTEKKLLVILGDKGVIALVTTSLGKTQNIWLSPGSIYITYCDVGEKMKIEVEPTNQEKVAIVEISLKL